MGRLHGNGGAGWKPAARKEADERATPLWRFSRSPEPVLVEVSTKDGAHVGSKPGTTKDRGLTLAQRKQPKCSQFSTGSSRRE